MKKILATLALAAALGSFGAPAFATTPDHADKDHHKGGDTFTPPAQTTPPVSPVAPANPPVSPPVAPPVSEPIVGVPVSQPVNPPITLPAVVPAAVAPRSLVTVQPPKEMRERAILLPAVPAETPVEPVAAITQAAPAAPAPKWDSAPAPKVPAAAPAPLEASRTTMGWEVPAGMALVGVGLIALAGRWLLSAPSYRKK